MNKINNTFLIYDYETFGKIPSIDRISQFASIRINKKFEIINKPDFFLCKPNIDYLPDPESILLTNITPNETIKNGLSEIYFAKKIYKILNLNNSCILGFNNINFDDEFTRYLFYRNFYDPYSWSWKNGNSRWDLLNVVYACYALRPNGIIWPKNKKGIKSFKLKDLTKANNIEHENKHNALSDVLATFKLAKLILNKQPKLFNYLYKNKNKNIIKKIININIMKPLIYISNKFGIKKYNISIITPINWCKKDLNKIIICDLNINNINILKILSINTIYNYLFNKKKNNNIYIPINTININRCPILITINNLKYINILRLKINFEKCLNNLFWLKQNINVQKKILSIFNNEIFNFIKSNDVNQQLYLNFFNNFDKKKINQITKMKKNELKYKKFNFQDIRLQKLLFFYKARNFPDILNKYEQKKWLIYKKNFFSIKKIKKYKKKLYLLSEKYKFNLFKLQLIKSLLKYINNIIINI